jgi:hypothetical protein
VVAKTKENGSYVQRLHALSVSTGVEKFGGPVEIQASVPGSGLGGNGTTIPFQPLLANQRPGLLLQSGVVGHAYSVRRRRESAYDRKNPHGLPTTARIRTGYRHQDSSLPTSPAKFGLIPPKCYRQTESSLPERILSRYVAVLISAKCVNACGKLPTCRPLGPICSE